MKAANQLTADRLRQRLNYDATTGVFTWKGGNNHVKAGRMAGVPDKSDGGYIKIMVDQRSYAAHRLAWLYVHGEWPKHTIDHINGIRGDNRIANLRDITRAENTRNRPLAAPSASGVVGVQAHGKRFRADRNNVYLGIFGTIEEAKAAYDAAGHNESTTQMEQEAA